MLSTTILHLPDNYWHNSSKSSYFFGWNCKTWDSIIYRIANILATSKRKVTMFLSLNFKLYSSLWRNNPQTATFALHLFQQKVNTAKARALYRIKSTIRPKILCLKILAPSPGGLKRNIYNGVARTSTPDSIICGSRLHTLCRGSMYECNANIRLRRGSSVRGTASSRWISARAVLLRDCFELGRMLRFIERYGDDFSSGKATKASRGARRSAFTCTLEIGVAICVESFHDREQSGCLLEKINRLCLDYLKSIRFSSIARGVHVERSAMIRPKLGGSFRW